MQCTAEALLYMLQRHGIAAKCFIDDICCVVSPEKSHSRLSSALKLINDLGLQFSPEKIQGPSTKITWLGIVFDTCKMEVSIPSEKLLETQSLVDQWMKKDSSSRQELQSLLGKLHHIARCVKPARLFVSCMMDAFRDSKWQVSRYLQSC